MARKSERLTVYLLKGLPACGKSTRAEELVVLQENGPTARVNKDSLREMCAFHKRGDRLRSEFSWEKQYQDAALAVGRVFLANGINVVVDDTNLKQFHEDLWRKVAYEFKAKLEIESFLDVPVEECVRRDSLRANPVGKGVIYSLAASVGLIESANLPVDIPEGYVVWDMDGTLVDTAELHFAAWVAACRELGRDFTRAYHSFAGSCASHFTSPR